MDYFEFEDDCSTMIGAIRDCKNAQGEIVKTPVTEMVREENLAKWIIANPHSHEVIMGDCKLYLDFDMECKSKEEYDDTCEAILIDLWESITDRFDDNPDFHLAGARSDGYSDAKKLWKISAHFVINGIGRRCCGVDWLPTVEKLRKMHPEFDAACYKEPGKKQSMRFVGARKMDDNRTLRPFKVIVAADGPLIMDLDPAKIQLCHYLITSCDGEEELTPLRDYDSVGPNKYLPDEDGEKTYSAAAIKLQIDHLTKLIKALNKDRASTEPAAFRGIGAIRRIASKYHSREAFRPLAHEFAKLTTRGNYNRGWVDGKYDQVRQRGPGYTTLRMWADEDTPGWNVTVAMQVKPTFYNDVRYLLANPETTEEDVRLYQLGCLAKVANNGNTVWFTRGENGWTLLTAGKEKFPYTTKSEAYKVSVTVANPKYNPKKAGSKETITIDRSYSEILEQLMTEPVFNECCSFDKTDFLPYVGKVSPHPKRVFNLFSPFKWDKRDDWKGPTKCQLLLNQIFDVLAGGNQDHYEYIVDIIAQIFQRPAEKIGICMVFRSKQRAGKNTVFDFIRRKMLALYSDELTDMDQLTQKHNSHRMRSLFTVLNEVANYGGSYKSNDKLKSIITDPQIKIEPKGGEAFTISDFCRYVMLTNNDWPVKNDKDEGRYACFQCSNAKIGQTQYFTDLHNSLDDDCAEDFFQMLMHRDLSARNFRLIPKTDFGAELAMNSESSAVQFLIDAANREVLFDDEKQTEVKISGVDLYTMYAAYCKSGNEFVMKRRAFGVELTKVGLVSKPVRVDTIEDGETVEKVCKGFAIGMADLRNLIRDHLKQPNLEFSN